MGIRITQAPYKTGTASFPSRTLGTAYQNTSVKPLLILISVQCAISLAGGQAFIIGNSDANNPPTTELGRVGIESSGLLNETNTFQLVLIVRPNEYYKVNKTETNGTVTVQKWTEISIG